MIEIVRTLVVSLVFVDFVLVFGILVKVLAFAHVTVFIFIKYSKIDS